jgi:DinB superfamily
MESDRPLRAQLSRLLAWEDSHVGFDKAVAGIPENLRGTAPQGLPYSPWQLLEHLRRTQRDILEFCVNSNYQELHWPDDYWPPTTGPDSPTAWDDSVRQYGEDRKALQRLAEDPKVDLFARIPHGQGQTYLRELILVADHTAYHLGELVVVRRLLGIWKPH